MSGGSLEYAYHKINDIISLMEERSELSISQKIFVEHLKDVSEALHAIEWVFSGDYSTGDDEEYIRKVISANYDELEIDILKKEAIKLSNNLILFANLKNKNYEP